MLSNLDIKIETISHEVAKKFIEDNHYSKKYPQAVKFRFGLYLESKLVGAAIFSIPANCFSLTSVLEGFDQRRGIELSRFYTEDNLPKNFETYCLSKCFKLIKETKEFDVILSYADETFGHTGALYKALNGIYLGKTKPETRYFYKGQYLTRRSLGRKKGDTEAAHRKRILEDGAIKTLSKPKHKFIWFICNKRKFAQKTRYLPLTFKEK